MITNIDLFGEQYQDTGRRAQAHQDQPTLWTAKAKPQLDEEPKRKEQKKKKEEESYKFFDETKDETERSYPI